MKKCVIVYNPMSGRKKCKKFIPKMMDIIKTYDYEVESVPTEYPGHASDIVEKLNHVDLVMSVGGDGTFNESITGNLRRKKKITLAHIPLGTTNDVGKMLGYGPDPIRNVRMTMDGVIKHVDIPMINDRPFVYVATIGELSDIPYETPSKLKKSLGYLAYVRQAAFAIMERNQVGEIEYEIDGKKYSGKYYLAFVSNSSRISGFDNFYRDIKLDDDKFEILFIKVENFFHVINSLYHISFFDATKIPNADFFRANNLKITFKKEPRKPWCIDGEKFEGTPLVYEFKNSSGINLLMPEKNANRLFLK